MAKYPGTLESNNPNEFGIVYATEVSGHKTVLVLTDLYTLPDAILSKTKNNTDNDAIGLLWFVVSENEYYKLISWNNRHSETGWEVFKSGMSDSEIEELNNIKTALANSKATYIEEPFEATAEKVDFKYSNYTNKWATKEDFSKPLPIASETLAGIITAQFKTLLDTLPDKIDSSTTNLNTIREELNTLKTNFENLLSANPDDSINSFNEVINFLQNIKDTDTLKEIIASLETKISESGDYTINGHKVSENPVLDKTDIGLGQVDNTSDMDKPISTATQEALDKKVDKVDGKSLVDDADIEKLANLPDSTELTNSIADAKAAGDNAQSNLDAHIQDTSNPHSVTKDQVGLSNVTNDAQVKRSEMGIADGVATLDNTGKVPSSQLPSYIDDIVDVYATYQKSSTGTISNIVLYSDAAKTQIVTGESGKIYLNVEEGEPSYQFRWTGSVFAQTGASSLVIGEVTGTAYDGAKGKANADNIAKIKGTALTHIKDAEPITITDEKVSFNYECFEGELYGSTGTAHTADIPAATTTAAGVMSAADKRKLNEVVAGAGVNVQADWNVTDTTDDAYIRNKPTSMPASDVSAWAKESTKPTYTKDEVGLGNVDNESKATMFTSPTFTGTPTAPTAAAGTSTTLIATTEFVSTAITNVTNELAEVKIYDVDNTSITKSDAGVISVKNLGVDSNKLANDAVTTSKIVDKAVTIDKLADDVTNTINNINTNLTNKADVDDLSNVLAEAVTNPSLEAAKKVTLKERDTNKTMYPVTDLASVMISGSSNLSILTQGSNGEVLTSENNVPVWKSIEKTEIPNNLVTTDTNQSIEGTKTFNKVVVKNGTSSQFLKADGSLDSNTYLTEHQSLANYYNKPEVDTLIAEAVTGGVGAIDLTKYETVEGAAEKYQPKGNYLTEHLDISGLATKQEVTNKIKEVVGTAPEALDTLGEIATKLSDNDDAVAAILNTLSEKANTSDVYNKTEIDGKVTTINSAITTETNRAKEAEGNLSDKIDIINGDASTTGSIANSLKTAKKYTDDEIAKVVTNADNKYATKDDVNNIHIPTKVSELLNDVPYLTEHQDISHLATKTYVTNALAPYETITGAASKYLPKGNYLTEHQDISGLATKLELSDAIAGIDITDLLAGYAKTADVEATYAKKSDIPSIDGLLSKTDADKLYQPKGNYLTQHQDISHLATKDELNAVSSAIPSLDGYATEQWVENKGYLTSASLTGINNQITNLDGRVDALESVGAEANVLESVSLNGTPLTINNKGVNIPPASTTSIGLLTAEDKKRLDDLYELLSWYDGD